MNQPAADLVTPALVGAAEDRLDRMLQDIQRLVEVETPSEDQEAVARGAQEVAALAAELLDTEAERIVVDGVTHLRIRFGADEDKNPAKVVLVNHQDTVWPHGTLARKPFTNIDGVLRGPGVFDMLTGVVMSLHAAALLQAQGHSLEGLSILITGDEEIASEASRGLIEEESRHARAALVMEAAAGEALKVGRKGTSNYVVVAHGRASHAGLEPEKGINAGIALGMLLPEIEALGDTATGTTVTPTVLKGGTTANTVPDRAEVVIDARAASIAELERVDREIRELSSPLPGARIEVLGSIHRPPMERATNQALFERAQQVGAKLGLAELQGVEVGGASDGNFTAALGVPTLDGMGAVGDGAHAEHEHALVDYIAPRTALLAGVIAAELG